MRRADDQAHSWSLIVIWVWHALQLGPPGPLNILFAAAFGTYKALRKDRRSTNSKKDSGS
jgi:hypothetical protein